MSADQGARGEKLKSLMGSRRRGIDLAQAEAVQSSYLTEGNELPLVLSPARERIDLLGWAQENLERIDRDLLRHGAILFRGFGLREVAAFERLAQVITPDLVNYVEGSSPRIMLSERVYTSTEYPPEFFVSLHNELSYAHRWPSRLFFFCMQAPPQGGETPIADSRKVLAMLPERIKDEFLRKGVRYTRNLHNGRGAGLSWQTVFETDDRAKVESYCREGGIEFRWKEDGGLSTSQVRPAAIRHPRTGELVWFNQADQFHPSSLPPEVTRALLEVSGDELPINATFGDGSPLDAGMLDEVRAVFRAALVAFPWQQGDVLAVDNMLVAHGRMPFSGPRRVVVTMGAPVSIDDVEAIGGGPASGSRWQQIRS